jgi:hypothetical protein
MLIFYYLSYFTSGTCVVSSGVTTSTGRSSLLDFRHPRFGLCCTGEGTSGPGITISSVLLWLLEFDLWRDAFVSPAAPSCDTFGKIDNKRSTLYGFIKILFYITYNINNDSGET